LQASPDNLLSCLRRSRWPVSAPDSLNWPDRASVVPR